MSKFQFFYDYQCPYCKKGYETLMELLQDYPDLEAEFLPIELNPKPIMNPCIRAFYIARELGADMDKFHSAMFQKAAVEMQNVRSSKVVADIIENIMDKEKFLEILNSEKYASKASENNDLAYEKDEVWFLPAFRVPGNQALRLDAKGGVGVSRDELKGFLDELVL